MRNGKGSMCASEDATLRQRKVTRPLAANAIPHLARLRAPFLSSSIEMIILVHLYMHLSAPDGETLHKHIPLGRT